MSDALEGLTVLDLSDTLAGASATLLFADFGAEVVHVEPPGGSALRHQPAYPMWARGKKSIELDLGAQADQQVARNLAGASDVVVETWRPGVAERLGLGYDVLAGDHPTLVYVSITGFGRSGPYAQVKGYEALVMAKLGIMSAYHQAVSRPGPAFPSVSFCSWSAAQTALHGALAALYERERSGVGQRVDTSLIQAITAHDTWNWYLHLIRDRYPDAYTPAPPFDADGIPSSPLLVMLLAALTADGRWVQFSQVQPHLFKAFMVALGLDWMFTDPEWAGLPMFDEQAKWKAFWGKLLEAARQRTLAEWQQVFADDPDVWAEIYRHGAELLDHPQLLHNGGVVELADRDRGPVRQPGAMVHLHATPAVIDRPAPRRDEHGAELRASSRFAPEASASTPALTSSAADRSGGAPLDGVTVLELGTFYAAPFGATLLADLGARVIKAEPLSGEPMRSIQPFPEAGGAKVLQGKESLAVDIGTDEGREIVHQLAGRVDIVLQSYRAGVAERHGVDAETLRSLNPDLLYLNAPAYGTDGPCARNPAFAPTIGAGAGLAMRNAGPSIEERTDLTLDEIMDNARRLISANIIVYAQADGCSALGVATAMLLGLLARQRGGGGQSMRTTMLSTNAHALSEQMVDYDGREPLPTADTELHGFGARYRLYPTADGWMFLAAPGPADWAPLAGALASYADLAGDGRFAGEDDRRANDDALAEVLARVFAERPADDWERDLTAADVGCVAVSPEPVEAVLLGDDFGPAADFVVDVVHPTFDEHPRLAPLVSFSRSSTRPGAGCLLGQHTDAVLVELGYGADRIADLRQRGVIV